MQEHIPDLPALQRFLSENPRLVVLSGVLLVTAAVGRSSTRLREKPVEAVESKPG